MKKNIILVIISVIFSLYTLNLIIVVVKFYKKDHYGLEKLNKVLDGSYDTRNSFQVYSENKKNGLKILPMVYGVDYLNYYKLNKKELFPLGTISNKKTIFCNEEGKWLYINTDRYGFNNIDQLWNFKKLNAIFIGDSFVAGECVKNSNNLSNQLSNKKDWNILNLGFPGNSPFQNLAAIKEYIIDTKNVDNIFWFFSEANDIQDLSIFKNSFLKNYLKNNFKQNLLEKQNKIDTELYNVIKFYEKEKLKDNFYLRQIKKILYLEELKLIIKSTFFKFNEDELLNIFFDIINEANRVSIENDIVFYLVYIPHDRRLIDSNYKMKKDLLKKQIIYYLNKKNIKFIDLVPFYENYKTPLDFSINKTANLGHFNTDGYEFFAEVIKNNLEN